MKYNTAKKYAHKMEGKFPEFQWIVIRKSVNNWLVRGMSDSKTKDYDLLDCVVNS